MDLAHAIARAGVDFLVSYPDSSLSPLLGHQPNWDDARRPGGMVIIQSANEANGVGLCAGAWLGGKSPALLLPTAGVFVAAWPLTSLNLAKGIPLVLIIGYRGGLGDDLWYMAPYATGTLRLLEALDVPHVTADSPGEAVEHAVRSALRSALAWLRPVAVLLSFEALSERPR